MEIYLKTQRNKRNSLFRVSIMSFLFFFLQYSIIWGQNVTFSGASLTVKKAFTEIEKQTDMSVEALNLILEGTGCSSVIKNNHIVISAEAIDQDKNHDNTLVITGTVTDEHGDPIIGANVMEKGTTNGCISDINGGYSLNVKSNSDLHIC